MAHGTEIITTPVTMPADLSAVLGIAGTDLAAACQSGAVNKWAKNKPIRFAKVAQLTAQNQIAANYGIADIPTWTRLDYMAIYLFSSDKGSLQSVYWPECDIAKGNLSLDYWVYLQPQGGASQPFRLSDFEYYYHGAEEPIGEMPSATVEIQPIGTMRIVFKMGAQSNYTLKLSDLTWPGSSGYSIGNMYFGVLAKQQTGLGAGTTYAAIQKSGDTFIKMSETTGTGFWVEFPGSFVSANWEGTWNIYPIISSVAFDPTSQLSLYNGNKFIAPLPFHSKNITVSIKYAQVLITNAVGYRDPQSQQRYVRVAITLQNTESVPRNYVVDVKLYNNQGVEQTGYTGRDTGRIDANTTTNVTVTIYVAQIWSSLYGGYFSATSNIDVSLESVKFYRQSSWGQTTLLEDLPR